jgi:hypothetical protein
MACIGSVLRNARTAVLPTPLTCTAMAPTVGNGPSKVFVANWVTRRVVRRRMNASSPSRLLHWTIQTL